MATIAGLRALTSSEPGDGRRAARPDLALYGGEWRLIKLRPASLPKILTEIRPPPVVITVLATGQGERNVSTVDGPQPSGQQRAGEIRGADCGETERRLERWVRGAARDVAVLGDV